VLTTAAGYAPEIGVGASLRRPDLENWPNAFQQPSDIDVVRLAKTADRFVLELQYWPDLLIRKVT
jgi:hypothetical protein